MSRGRPSLSPIEAALIVCVAGTALAVFVPTFVDRVRTNKILEASELLMEMSDRAAMYYATVWEDGQRRCLPPSAGPTPPTPAQDPVVIDFQSDDTPDHRSWRALGFQPDRPIRYTYRFETSETGCSLGADETDNVVTFIAEGDLDGDGVRSRFERTSRPRPDGTLEALGELRVYRRVE